jgi:hypothetical protein
VWGLESTPEGVHACMDGAWTVHGHACLALLSPPPHARWEGPRFRIQARMHACMHACVRVCAQASLQGISSLTKETSTLEVGHDASGATTLNQYVLIKTLGRGCFGKVKLCLNTMDGQVGRGGLACAVSCHARAAA